MPLTFPASKPTTLPAGSVLMRVITGDSLAGIIDTISGASTGIGVEDMSDQSLRVGRDPATDTTIEPHAYYWSRWLHDEGSGYISTRRLTTTATTNEKWERLTDRSGWNNGGPFTPISAAPDVPLAWLIHKWAEQIGHGYVEEGTGAPIPVYYVIGSFSGSQLARGAANNASWDSSDVDTDTRYNLFVNNYLSPAIASLKTITRRNLARHLGADQADALALIESRVYCDMFLFTAGGADAHLGNGSATNANALGANLVTTIGDLHAVMKCKPPTILVRPFDPDYNLSGADQYPYIVQAQASFDAMVADADGDGRSSYLMYVDLSDGIETQELLSPPVNITTTYGIHPSPDGATEMARRIVVKLAERSGGDFGAIDGGDAAGIGVPALVRLVP